MATNFEFYKDEILKIAQKQATPVLTKDGDISGCNFTDCPKCAFQGSDCRSKQMNWLYAEHIEAPKLTKRERAFCEAVQTGWIIDFGGIAYWTNMEPVGSGEKWHFNSDSNAARLRDFKLGFEWLGAYQSCKVEDLLKLDVIEEVQEDA